MTDTPAAPTPLPTPRPRRTLFRVLLALYILWMLALAVLWYTTVHSPHTSPRPPVPLPTSRP